MYINGEIPSLSVVGNLKVFGETKKNSLKEKIRKQFLKNREHCPLPELPVINGQNNQPTDAISQAIGTLGQGALQNLGRRKFRRSGRQLR